MCYLSKIPTVLKLYIIFKNKFVISMLKKKIHFEFGYFTYYSKNCLKISCEQLIIN